jgi:hypothetical protein
MISTSVQVDLNTWDQKGSHKVARLDYVSESGNVHGTCLHCGEQLNFYLGDYTQSTLIFIINPGLYLLHKQEGYMKVNIEPCRNKELQSKEYLDKVSKESFMKVMLSDIVKKTVNLTIQNHPTVADTLTLRLSDPDGSVEAQISFSGLLKILTFLMNV